MELKSAASDAVETMKELLRVENEGIRFRAADSILTHIYKFKEVDEIGERLARLEKALED